MGKKKPGQTRVVPKLILDHLGCSNKESSADEPRCITIGLPAVRGMRQHVNTSTQANAAQK